MMERWFSLLDRLSRSSVLILSLVFGSSFSCSMCCIIMLILFKIYLYNHSWYRCINLIAFLGIADFLLVALLSIIWFSIIILLSSSISSDRLELLLNTLRSWWLLLRLLLRISLKIDIEVILILLLYAFALVSYLRSNINS